MSIASSILEQSADVLAAGHNDPMVLQPVNVIVGGYAQERSADKHQPMLSTAEDVATHFVFIRRSELSNVTLEDISHIESGGQSYRVHSFRNDRNFPEVRFSCTLA